MTAGDQDWTISIFVPDGEDELDEPDPSAEDHAFRDIFGRGSSIARVSGRELQAQWAGTIEHLLKLSASVGEKTAGWRIEQMEVGLTLSAKGELLFIAEAGAEASIKLTLKRKDAPTTPAAG
jgi:hypothetical protein